ncbi:lysoplasmalogenase family protein [Sandaracinobacteroides hominis]|uniref:lysoplasmalogenase family protein n=1 Tax=Sandaracinobacteroides hominis TaxID=2780086 RepID=UPI0018F58D1F|nr:lysoplasmalogenase family protein [Sandaracinobacteroides hominis]
MILRHNWIFLAAIAAGLSYMASRGWNLPPAAAIAWKGAGVGLLAVWASSQGRSTNHRLLASVLALGAIADMVLELNFIGGAAVFALGHVVAITLYLRNRRAGARQAQFAFALILFAGSIALAATLAPAGWKLAIAFYTLFLAAMAATASLSRFPLAFAGALLFLLSDLLIFARMEILASIGWASYAIWLTYFGGQAMIAWGVASRLGGISSKLDISRARH